MHVSDEEIDAILDEVIEIYGYDFSNYTRASLKRRINRLYVLDRFTSFAEFFYRIRTNEPYFRRFVQEITVNVTEMFRDPDFYRMLREEVLPRVATHPHIRIWHAGCSTGEEVYSMAILLKEAGILHKSLLYATDINPEVLDRMMRGFFPLSQMKQYSENYIASGGLEDFSRYYTANYESARFDPELAEKIIHSTHNLVSDRSFNEFHMIVCRNVLIYFDKDLQNRVFSVMDESLAPLGYLCLGSKETLKFSSIAKKYAQVKNEKIWKKIR
jgi:chemotaxis protein methyltransferase CheR